MNTLQPQTQLNVGMVPGNQNVGAPLMGTTVAMPHQMFISPPTSVGNMAPGIMPAWPNIHMAHGPIPGSALSSAPSTPRQGEATLVPDWMGGPMYFTPNASGTNTPNTAAQFLPTIPGAMGPPLGYLPPLQNPLFGFGNVPFTLPAAPFSLNATPTITPVFTPQSSTHSTPVHTPKMSPVRVTAGPMMANGVAAADHKDSPAKRKSCIVEKGEHTGIITPASSPPPHSTLSKALRKTKGAVAVPVAGADGAGAAAAAATNTSSPIVSPKIRVEEPLIVIDEEHDEIPMLELGLAPQLKMPMLSENGLLPANGTAKLIGQTTGALGSAVSVIPAQHNKPRTTFNPMLPMVPPVIGMPSQTRGPPQLGPPPVTQHGPAMGGSGPQRPTYYNQQPSYIRYGSMAPQGLAPPQQAMYFPPYYNVGPPVPPSQMAAAAQQQQMLRLMSGMGVMPRPIPSNPVAVSSVGPPGQPPPPAGMTGASSSVSSDDGLPSHNVEGAIEKLNRQMNSQRRPPTGQQQMVPPPPYMGHPGVHGVSHPIHQGIMGHQVRPQDSKIDRVRREYHNTALVSDWKSASTSATKLNDLRAAMNSRCGLALDLRPRLAKFFVIKSFGEDDVHKSIKYNVWCSTEKGNAKLNEAWRDRCAELSQVEKEMQMNGDRDPSGGEPVIDYPIYLFYSVNRSGRFCGVARLESGYDKSSNETIWMEDGKWNGKFNVSWFMVKDVPNSHLKHILLPNNDNKPVTYSRDTQEIPFEQGCVVLNTFVNYHSSQSLLDNYLYYDKREDQMQHSKATFAHSSHPSSSFHSDHPHHPPPPPSSSSSWRNHSNANSNSTTHRERRRDHSYAHAHTHGHAHGHRDGGYNDYERRSAPRGAGSRYRSQKFY